MRVLHTSDWHLGRTLYNRIRYKEQQAFLDWLLDCCQREAIDILLIAGDIFDNTTPSHQAQQLYYQFLHRATLICQQIVVIGGNHDSPSLLDAPRALLAQNNIHVVGGAELDLDAQVLVVNNTEQQAMAIICAVPYLRDNLIRQAKPGESFADKDNKLIQGIQQHYQNVVALAEQQRVESAQPVPIIAMGHLFTAQGKTIEGDGVRDLYIGSLAHFDAALFPDCIDYLALGHLHSAQKVGGQDHLRYSGSPIAMGFGEAKQQKMVLKIEFEQCQPTVNPIPVPCFQALVQISGDLAHITAKIEHLVADDRSAWLEIIYQGAIMPPAELNQQIQELVQDTELDVLQLKQSAARHYTLSPQAMESLDNLSVFEVFERCLETQQEVPAEDLSELRQAYQEILMQLEHVD